MRNRNKCLALLTAMALTLALLSGCGGEDTPLPPASAPAADGTGAEQGGETAPPASAPAPAKNEQPQDAEPVEPTGDDAAQDTGGEAADVQPEEPAKEAEPASGLAPAPESEPEKEPEPAPEPVETVPEDGTYTASVTLEGGTGRAKVDSPAMLRCENGKFYAVIVWSSPNFDYMKVGGEKYLQTNTEGNSTFEIPVAAFDQKLDVIADTVAMSEPHEVEYTLYFDSSTLQKQ